MSRAYRGALLSGLPTHGCVTVRAPAKINLVLNVGALRPDGYHGLTTLFHAVGCYDEVQVVRGGAAPSVRVQGAYADGVPLDGANLAVRAALLLAEHTGADPGVRITIDKDIPVAGGCAGGSADAAATLLACNALWGTGLTVDELARLAARLGSDVPFSLLGGTALGTGRGEQLTPVPTRGSLHWVLVVADGSLSTPAVYAELDRQRGDRVAQAGPPAAAMAALADGDPEALGRALCNDLQPPALALRPGLRHVLDRAVELGALGGLVSGSGPTVAVLARDRVHAEALTVGLLEVPGCRAALAADGPVAGAHLLPSAVRDGA